MKMMQRENTEDTKSGIAQIIASIPLIVYKAFFTLVVVLVGVLIIARFFPANSGIRAFASNLTTWLTYGVIMIGVVIGVKLAYGVFLIWHDFRLKNAEYAAVQLSNQMKAEKILREREERLTISDFREKYVERALQYGLNVDFAKKTVASPFSNVHTLAGNNGMPQVVDANPLNQIEAPQRRLTVEEICSHIDRNSYKIFIGSSLTTIGNPVSTSIYKRHLRIIGSSQKGKSSFVAALLDIISRTHDPEYVQFALLDKEYMTSKLFASLPHVLTVIDNDRPTPVHAKNTNEVVTCLTYLLRILEARYTMRKSEIAKEPLIIVYIEEYLRLKRELQARCKTALDKEEAERMYAQFTFIVGQIAGLGLKVRIQLWLVSQMDYAEKDSDLQETAGNITSGVSFCLSRPGALAAGFCSTELINKNAQDKKPGQAVCEMPDCVDLILSPEYDLEKRLQAFEEAEMQEEEEESTPVYTRPYLLSTDTPTYTPSTEVDTPAELPAVKQSNITLATLQDAIDVWNEVIDNTGKAIGREALQRELNNRGLTCSDDRAKKLIKAIKERLPVEKAE